MTRERQRTIRFHRSLPAPARKGTTAVPRGARSRVMVLAAAAPIVAQIMMLAMMTLHRQWMFALVMVPGIVGGLASMLVTLPLPYVEPSQSPVESTETHHAPRGPSPDAADMFCTSDAPSIESLLTFDRLGWRTIVRNWLEPSDYDVPLGVTASGPFMLNLHRQGPHALVAGTTGSGKSVLLQSWCLALAAMNGPDQLNFVFLDFKGGAAFRKLEQLPHTIGSVCDLDLAHAARALKALEAELTRREKLSADLHVSDIDDMRDAPPRLVVVIDEFHALKDQLPDYMPRLVRIASLGRSLGMHLIACTQNPLGQVSTDMKANMAISICLRVRDGLQSTELLGDSRAATISPALPGAAYCNDGEHVTAFRCAPADNIDVYCRQIAFAAQFVGTRSRPSLFTSPLPRSVQDHPVSGQVDRIRFGLSDNGITLTDAVVPLDCGNIAIIGPQGRGKTTLLEVIARQVSAMDGLMLHISGLYRGQRLTTTEHRSRLSAASTRIAPAPPRLIWLVDDADDLLDPLCCDTQAVRFRQALADSSIIVVFAVRSPRHIRVPDHCSTRIVFPCGDRTADLVAGIPSSLVNTMSQEDLDTPGRAVLIAGASACLVQCAS